MAKCGSGSSVPPQALSSEIPAAGTPMSVVSPRSGSLNQNAARRVPRSTLAPLALWVQPPPEPGGVGGGEP